MTDPRKESGSRELKTRPRQQKDESKRPHRSKTAGTNRDFDGTGESDNQAHGHPREERGRTTD